MSFTDTPKENNSPESLALYTAAQVSAIDHKAIEQQSIPAQVLMKRAGREAFDYLLETWPDVECLHIFCGAGNNAGDGYVMAALARQRHLSVHVWVLSNPEALQGAARQAWQYAVQEGVDCKVFDELTPIFGSEDPQITVVVDALLGTGSKGGLRQPYQQAITCINSSGLPVLAVDIPSGIHPDTGAFLDETDVDETEGANAVRADVTVSFVGQKAGLFTGKGRVYSGQRYFSNLDIPMLAYDDIEPMAEKVAYQDWLPLLPPRLPDFHKGDCGHALIVGGDAGTAYGYGGAGIMAAKMALRSGAGLVSLATRPCFIASALASQPEVMAAGINNGQELLPLLERVSAVVIGPGLGQSSWSEQLLYHVLKTSLPLVLDADALHLLSQERFFQLTEIPKAERQWILTPHPGEAAALLGISTAQVQADRFSAAQAIQYKLGGVVILKGAGTVIVGSDGKQWVCDQGNAGMASGGMGDVLSGLLGALLVQGMTIDAAALLGVSLHAQAADEAVVHTGQRGLLATDLIPYIQRMLG